MAKAVKKGQKPTGKKLEALKKLAKAKKTTASKRAAVKVTKKTTKGGTATSTRKAKIGFIKAIHNTPEFFKAGRSTDELAKDFQKEGKVAKISKNGKYYVEYKGKDGKKHREYRANRMDYKFGI